MQFNYPINLENSDFITETLFFNFDDVHKHDDNYCEYVNHQNSLLDEDRDPDEFDEKYEDPTNNQFSEIFIEELNNVCLDAKGNRRRGVGIVNSRPNNLEDEYNEVFVPSYRYTIETCPWNSHQYYIDVLLPNPANRYKEYKFIRKRMLELIKEVAEENNVILTKKNFR